LKPGRFAAIITTTVAPSVYWRPTMRIRLLLILAISLAVPLAVATALAALADSTEIEPNNTPGSANPLGPSVTMTGSISPVADVDYYALDGVNPSWGFIALLDTLSSTTSTSGTLTALGSDGATVLQSDTGSWERGSGIALQSYADGASVHYLRVTQAGNTDRITGYKLRYVRTVVSAQPEVEPNDTRATGTPSSFTHSGILSPTSDVDCFAFQGRAGDRIIIALDSKGSTIDPLLRLVGPGDTVLKTANVTGLGGKEFIDYAGLPSDGVYAYCVSAAAGVGGAGATYRVGVTRNGFLYFPSYLHGTSWLNQPPRGFALVDDLLTFRLAVTNTSPITIPGNIRLTTSFSAACLLMVSSVPTPTTSSPGHISWDNQKTGLAPGEVYSVTFTGRGLIQCSDTIYQDTGLAYYFTGSGDYLPYSVDANLYLPLVRRGP
jgi:hypothetical protein